MIHTETPTLPTEGRAPAPVVDDRKVPVAYEEVSLTEEAVEILERERLAAEKRPPRKIRRVAVSE